MKLGVVRAFLAAVLLVKLGGVAYAQPTYMSFRGTITEATASQFPEIAVGTPFTGYYIYNYSTPDTNNAPALGNYPHTSRPYGVVVSIGNRVFRTDPSNVNFVVGVINNFNGRDNFVIQSHNNLDTDGVQVHSISWQLDDLTQTALTNDALPMPFMPLDLSQWTQPGGLIVSADDMGGFYFFIKGNVEEMVVGTGLYVPPTGMGPQGPAGPAGPQGVAGVQGPAGPQGEGLMSDSLLMLPVGTPAPAGYTYVGKFTLFPALQIPPIGPVTVMLYKKN